VFELEVVDVTGALIPNAAVTIVNKKTGTRVDAKTDASGQLRFADLPSGIYEITVSSTGFKTLELIDLVVPARDHLKLQLELGLSILMGEVVSIDQVAEPSPIPALLAEASPAQSSITISSPHHPNAFRRFFSALRRMF
jgi:hypothetical protein